MSTNGTGVCDTWIQFPDTDDFEVTEYAVKRRETCDIPSLCVSNISSEIAAKDLHTYARAGL